MVVSRLNLADILLSKFQCFILSHLSLKIEADKILSPILDNDP